MFCEGCGAQLPSSGAFCPGCGSKAGVDAVYGSSPQGLTSAEIAERAKAASKDALEALKLFALDPTGGLLPAFRNLDKQRAIGVSGAFALIFDVCLLFGVYRTLSLLRQANDSLGFLGTLGLGEIGPDNPSFFKLFLFGLVPFIGLSLALVLARLIFRGSGQIEGDVFTAGAALLPFGFLIVAGTLLGFANIEVIAVLFLFALSYTILILFTGCTRIAKISDAGAAGAVPLVLLMSAYIAKVIFSSLWSAGVAG